MISCMWSMYSCFSASGLVSSKRRKLRPRVCAAIPRSTNMACAMSASCLEPWLREKCPFGRTRKASARVLLAAVHGRKAQRAAVPSHGRCEGSRWAPAETSSPPHRPCEQGAPRVLPAAYQTRDNEGDLRAALRTRANSNAKVCLQALKFHCRALGSQSVLQCSPRSRLGGFISLKTSCPASSAPACWRSA